MPELQTPQPLIDLRSIEEFVLKYPSETLASLIVEQAQEIGIELEIRQVHRIRDQERQRTAKTSAPSSPDPSGEESDGEEDDGDDSDDDSDEEHNPEDQGGHDGTTEAEGAAGAGDGSAPKRRGRKPGGPDTKAGFVRSLPLSLPAKEVVALALEQRNFEITEAYVSAIRSKLLPSEGKRRRRRKQAAPTPVTPVSTASVSRETLPDPIPVSPAISPPPASVGPAVPAVSASAFVAVSAPPAASAFVAVSAPLVAPEAVAVSAPVFRSTEGVAVADVEEEFARLVLEIGLVRAEQLLGRFKERLARFVRG